MAEYSWAELSEQYQQFSVPAVSVLLNKEELTDMAHVSVHQVEVNLQLHDASEAEIDIWGFYDEEQQSIDSTLKAKLLPGVLVEVKLGYVSAFQTVFSGYLDQVEFVMTEKDFGSLKLRACDVVKRMKASSHLRSFAQDTFSGIFDSVFEPYSWLCSSETGTSDSVPEGELRIQRQDDYTFVTEQLAGPENPDWEFYVQKGVAYFQEIDTKKDPVTSLTPENGIMELRASWNFVNQKITCQGCGAALTTFVGTDTAKAEILSDSAGADQCFSCVPVLECQEKVDAWVQAKVQAAMAEAKKASLVVIGVPELVAGACVELAEVDPQINGTYRICRAEHVLDEKGYRTSLELEGV